MSDRRSPSGPSNASSRTWVAASGRRPSPKTTAGGASGQLHHAQLASSARRRSSPAAGSTRVRLVPDQLGRPDRAAGLEGEPGRQLGVVAQPVEDRAAARAACRASAHDPRPPRLAERPGDPREDARSGPCRSRGGARRGGARRRSSRRRAERRHDVEAVAPVGDVHPVEQGELGRRQPRRRGRHARTARTRARRWLRNWRTLDAQEKVGELIDDLSDDPAEGREDDREDHHQEDDAAVLGEHRPELPGGRRADDPEQERRPVERRDRDQVEDRQDDVDRDERRSTTSQAIDRRRSRPLARPGSGRRSPPATAMIRFEAGPASATRTSPLRRSRRLFGLTGVGFAQPKMSPPPRNVVSTRSRPPIGSKWTTGLRRQPAEHLGRPVAEPIGHEGMGELVDREGQEEEDRDEECDSR